MGVWASLKSWLFVTPIILFAAGLPKPYPIIVLAIISIYCAKIFFTWWEYTTALGSYSYVIYLLPSWPIVSTINTIRSFPYYQWFSYLV